MPPYVGLIWIQYVLISVSGLQPVLIALAPAIGLRAPIGSVAKYAYCFSRLFLCGLLVSVI